MNGIELRHLRCLIAVVEEGSFGRAALRLGTSQPAVSQLLKRLEDVIGHRLVDRRQTPVLPTAVGARVLVAARRAQGAVEEALAEAWRAARGEVGRLRVGFNAPALYNRVPELIRSFRDYHPGVQVDMTLVASQEQAGALEDRRVDVTFGAMPIGGRGIGQIEVARERLLLALPRDHALAGRGIPRLADMRDEAWVTPAGGTPVRDDLEVHCRALGFQPRIAAESVDFIAIFGLVRAGAGIALAAESFEAFAGPDVVLTPLADFAPWLRTYLGWREDEEDPAVRAFLDHAKASS
ncbi:MAG: LysR family transcriptional regulator [Zavarzinia sp.]|nr:LysR family transcriptional regulator [Zavarzinia sp.]